MRRNKLTQTISLLVSIFFSRDDEDDDDGGEEEEEIESLLLIESAGVSSDCCCCGAGSDGLIGGVSSVLVDDGDMDCGDDSGEMTDCFGFLSASLLIVRSLLPLLLLFLYMNVS